jgi:hypothetical protein
MSTSFGSAEPPVATLGFIPNPKLRFLHQYREVIGDDRATHRSSPIFRP